MVVQRQAEDGVLLIAGRIVGNTVSGNLIGRVVSGYRPLRGGPQAGIRGYLEAQVGHIDISMERAVRSAVLSAVSRIAAKIIETLPVPAHAAVFVIGAERPAVGA